METKNIISKDEHDNQIQRLKCKLQVMERKFNIEKDCKNEAYAFILESGLFKEYVEFNKAHKGQDHHIICIEKLEKMSL